MSDTLFQSPNINLRRLTVDDGPFIFELLNTSTWKQFIGDRNINTQQNAVNYIINGPQGLYDKYGYGPWLVSLKDTGDPIGICGLFKRDYLDKPDLGFALLPKFEGQGFAYEAAKSSIQYVKDTYEVDKLYATTTDANMRSQGLLERCGFVRSGLVTPPGEETLLLYTLTLQ